MVGYLPQMLGIQQGAQMGQGTLLGQFLNPASMAVDPRPPRYRFSQLDRPPLSIVPETHPRMGWTIPAHTAYENPLLGLASTGAHNPADFLAVQGASDDALMRYFHARLTGQPGNPADLEPTMNSPMMNFALGLNDPGGVYHGSPHLFDRFDINKVGTGEGGQMYGHGMYFAENPAVAQTYAHDFSGTRDYELTTGGRIPRWVGNSLKNGGNVDEHIAEFKGRIEDVLQSGNSQDQWRIHGLQSIVDNLEAIKAGKAQAYDPSFVYRANAPALNPDHFLDWEQPISGQPHVANLSPEAMGAKFKQLDNGYMAFVNHQNRPLGNMQKGGSPESFRQRWQADLQSHKTGADLYKWLSSGSQWEASAALQNAGVPGIKYLDKGSRQVGEGTRNYVVFDPSQMQILERK